VPVGQIGPAQHGTFACPNGSSRRQIGLRLQTDFMSAIKLICPVQSSHEKYSDFAF
jgi:hypothetical protein